MPETAQEPPEWKSGKVFLTLPSAADIMLIDPFGESSSALPAKRKLSGWARCRKTNPPVAMKETECDSLFPNAFRL
jgi:hypothetical protein